MHLREWKFMPEGSSVCGAGGRGTEAYDRKLRGCENGVLPLVSVRLNRAVPKEKLFEVMAEIRKLSLNAPVHTGDLIVENILGLGSDLIATKNVEKQ